MAEKITQTKHIRQQLEKLYQQKYCDSKLPKPKQKKYKGLGLNWRDSVILVLALFFVGLYQVQAIAGPEINTDIQLQQQI
jgi:hypothetical protein